MSGPQHRVAYLVSQYPALSHAFIEREVLALRELGVEVDTFSVRPASTGSPFSAVTVQEAARTTDLLGRGPATYARAHATLLATRPAAWLSGLRAAVRSGPLRPRAKVWQAFYFAEAVVLLQDLRARGVHHLHVHFANNAADVAHLTVAMGHRADGDDAGWRWTLSIHGPTDFTQVAERNVVAKLRSADTVACISEYAREVVAGLAGEDHRSKLAVVRMSVSTDAYPAMGGARADREGEPLRLLFVGRLVAEKGPELLVEAVDLLRARGVAVEAAVIGHGPLDGALREQVARLGLEEQVRLVGPVGQDALPGWYGWADVFCLPSYAEGVPVVLMEAMATELPVVTTRITGIPELVEDGRSGVLIEPGHADQLADAVERLGAAPSVRREMGVRGRERVSQEFAPRRNAERLVAAWDGPAGR